MLEQEQAPVEMLALLEKEQAHAEPAVVSLEQERPKTTQRPNTVDYPCDH